MLKGFLKKLLGNRGERKAASYLRKQGYRILARQYRNRIGEIDLIARDSEFVVFVEVKTRSSLKFGTPEEAVGPRKQRQIISTAQWYLQQRQVGKLQTRFDVISVLADGEQTRIEHFPNAFDA